MVVNFISKNLKILNLEQQKIQKCKASSSENMKNENVSEIWSSFYLEMWRYFITEVVLHYIAQIYCKKYQYINYFGVNLQI